MRRLQQIVGGPILANSGKSFGLTPQGEIVLEYAKQIVALNDECVGRLDGGILTGTIRVGIPSDFALSFLPQLLGQFSETHPDVALDVTCELSRDLIGGLARNEFDVVLAVHDDRSIAHLTDEWREPMAWVGSQTQDLRARRPLPLVLFPDGCQYRLRVLSALRRRDIPYKIVYSSSNLAGNQAAIESGLGLTGISPEHRAAHAALDATVRGAARSRRLRYRPLLEPRRGDRCHSRADGRHRRGARPQAHPDDGAGTRDGGSWLRRGALGGPAGRAPMRSCSKAATASSRRSRSNGRRRLRWTSSTGCSRRSSPSLAPSPRFARMSRARSRSAIRLSRPARSASTWCPGHSLREALDALIAAERLTVSERHGPGAQVWSRTPR